jgi:hypothetical protein
MTENIKTVEWVLPSYDDLVHEYAREYETKALKSITNDAWPELENFIYSTTVAEHVEVTPEMDSRIAYRSGTTTREGLRALLSGYRSWPEYRNDDTIDALYRGFKTGAKMLMPIVLRFKDGSMRVMGGNTRMDVAFQCGINPVVLMINVPE